MGKKYYAGAILAILAFAACGGEYTPSKEEAEIIQHLERGNKISPAKQDTSVFELVFETDFILLPDGKIIKEKKGFKISDKFIIMDGDTISRDGQDMGYFVISFPYKQVKSFPINYTSGKVQLGDLLYSMSLPRHKVENSYTIIKGDTKKVLISKGVPSHKIPKVPQVGQIITW